MTSVAVGALACQRDSFLASLKTKICSVVKAAAAKQFEVVLQDTVCFCEGGGQPADRGTIAHESGAPAIAISNAIRRGNTAVHIVESDAADVPAFPFKEGDDVVVAIDVARRRDHMQHHTAQHVLTAVLEQMNPKWPTECWSLTHPACFVQLPVKGLTDDEVAEAERRCNELIAAGTKVNVVTYESRDSVPAARSRGIPADVTGPIRIVEVEGLDTCTCCGTHVTSLAQLGCIKLLHQEAKGNTVRLHFVAGDRARAMFSDMYARERALVKQVGCQASQLLEQIDQRSKSLAAAQKSEKKLRGELAALLAPSIVQQASLPSYSDTAPAAAAAAAASGAAPSSVFVFHREDADVEMLSVWMDALQKSGVTATRVVVLACGSLKGGAASEPGSFLVGGPSDEAVKACVETQLLPALGPTAKGNAVRAVFRGKAELAAGWKNFVKGCQKK